MSITPEWIRDNIKSLPPANVSQAQRDAAQKKIAAIKKINQPIKSI